MVPDDKPGDDQTKTGDDQTKTGGDPTAGAPEWMKGIADRDLLSNPALRNHKDVVSLAKEHVNLQGLIGRKGVILPGPDAKPEEIEKYRKAIGVPDSPSAYDLKEIDPKELPWDQNFHGKLLAEMNKANMTNSQVVSVLKAASRIVAEDSAAIEAKITENREQVLAKLRSEWGKAFDAHAERAKNAWDTVFGKSAETISGIVLQDGTILGDHPEILRAFAKLGDQMKEAGLLQGEASKRGTLEPKEAQSALDQLMLDPVFKKALLDPTDPGHASAKSRRQQLYQQIYAA